MDKLQLYWLPSHGISSRLCCVGVQAACTPPDKTLGDVIDRSVISSCPQRCESSFNPPVRSYIWLTKRECIFVLRVISIIKCIVHFSVLEFSQCCEC